VTALASVALGLATVAVTSTSAGATAPPRPKLLFQRVCGTPQVGTASCFAERSTQASTSTISPAATPAGYGPADIQSAYNLPSGLGAGRTVAIVDAYDLPTAESNLATYRSQYGLPACTTANGCFRKINQNGGSTPPTANSGWGVEIALDLDTVSATCPQCKILLVEANNASFSNLGTAVNQAATQGAVAISNSWGAAESFSETSYDTSYFRHPGIAVVAATGDGSYGTEYPAASPYVTAVGGTTLTHASNARGWTESAWGGAGSGCSSREAKPAFQTDTGCARRTIADVSAVADPATGVAVYDSYASGGGWGVYGGTSVATPIISAIFAMAGSPPANVLPVQYPYANPGALFDVVGGTNGSCNPAYLCHGAAGYDGPTGLGTPNGLAAFGPAVATNNFSISDSPTSQSVDPGNPATTTVSTLTTSGSAQSVSLSASGLPAGASAGFSPASVTSGGSSTLTLTTSASTPAGTYVITITGTGTTATHSTTFSLTVNSSGGGGGGGGGGSDVLVNGGFETGNLSGWTPSGASSSVISTDVHSGSFAAQLGKTTATNNLSNIAQTFTASAGATQLSFWYKMRCGNSHYDYAGASLTDSTAGATTQPLPHTCVTSTSYVHVTVSIVAGHTYTLTLTNRDDGAYASPTYTKFDDVSVS
jgi:hypothetical protein